MAMKDAEFERQAVLYAMGALSPQEARRFEAERKRRGARGERIERGIRQAIESAGGPGSIVPSERRALAAVTAPGPPPERPWGWIVATIALVLAGAGLLVWGLDERSRAEEEARAAALHLRTIDSLRSAGRAGAEEGAPRADEFAPLLAAPALVVVPLVGAAGVEGRLLAAPERGALLVASGLPPLPERGVYQLWRRTGEVTEAVAALGDAPRGFLFAVFSDGDFFAEGGGMLLVTGEAGPGAPFPSEPAVLAGPLPR